MKIILWTYLVHLTKVFYFCGETTCYGGKGLDLETNQPGLESGFYHLLLDDLGQIIQSSELQLPVMETFWSYYSVQSPQFGVIAPPIFTYLMWWGF